MMCIMSVAGLFLPQSVESGLATQASVVTTTSAPSSVIAPIILFIDRFGTVYWKQEPIKVDVVFSVLEGQMFSRRSIVLMYDPISLEVDRRRFFQTLRAAFPQSQIVFQAAQGGEYEKWLFPVHKVEMVDMFFDEGLSSHPLKVGPDAMIDQLVVYLTDILRRSNRIGSVSEFVDREDQHPTPAQEVVGKKKTDSIPSVTE
jgi:hypothetical protein